MAYGGHALVWFVYIKSPLGTVLRYHKQAVIGIFTTHNDALMAVNRLRDRLSADLRIIRLRGSTSEVYDMALLDPDLADVVNLVKDKTGEVFLVLAVWS